MDTATDNLAAALRDLLRLANLASAEGRFADGIGDELDACETAAEAIAAWGAEQQRPALKLSGQDRATILAALRYYQQEGMGEPDNRSDDIHDIATNNDAEISLDDEGIDDLCERINTDQVARAPQPLGDAPRGTL